MVTNLTRAHQIAVAAARVSWLGRRGKEMGAAGSF
jgi:hypothetical protein